MTRTDNLLPSITIDTVVAISQHSSGNASVFPIADPSFVSFGSVEECLLEQSLFLGEYLAAADPEVVARFSTPPDAVLEQITIEIPRGDLPDRLQPKVPVGLSCVILPHRRHRWVVVLPLKFVVYVAENESVEERVRSEVVRQTGALELDGHQWLSLLPAQSQSLHRLQIEVTRKNVPVASAANLKKRLLDAQLDKAALQVLREIGDPLHGDRVKALPPVHGRERELDMLDALLQAKQRAAVMLVGEKLSGKSAMISAWLQRLHARRDEQFVFATSGAQLVAGMSGLGQWQERVRRTFEAAERLNAVLVFDALRDLFTDRGGGHVDLAGAVKPYLEQGRVRVIGEISPEDADLQAHRNPGFIAAFSPLRVPALDRRAARAALNARLDHAKLHYADRPTLARDAVDTVLELTARYLPYRPFPGKAIRLFEELRDLVEREHMRDLQVLSVNDAYELFSLQTGIPAFLLREDRRLVADKARSEIARKLVGQKEAVRRVVDTLCVVKAGLQPARKPLATFLFVGPTGVGKTELARTLAVFLFGDEERLIRFDMSEFSGGDAALRLIHGRGAGEGLLTQRVRQQPFAVVLLDEIEKAHSSVFDLLLQVLGEARLTDDRGTVTHFDNVIVIMTSNVGSQDRSQPIGLASTEGAEVRYQQEIDNAFRPEFVNRIDAIIPFSALTPDEVREVTGLAVQSLTRRRGFVELGIAIDVSDLALASVASEGFSSTFGARAMRRHLEDHIVAPSARLLGALGPQAKNARLQIRRLDEETGPSDRVLGSRQTGSLRIEAQAGHGASARRDVLEFQQIASLRRRVQAWDSLPAVEEIAERMRFLTTEMTYGQNTRPEKLDIAGLTSEHYRLHQRWQALAAPRREIEDLEELALSAVLAGEGLDRIQSTTDKLAAAVNHAMVRLLVALVPRNQIILRLQEYDNQRTLNRWLLPLLRAKARWGWNLQVHVFGDDARERGWPPRRPFGSARSADELQELLDARSRKPMTALMIATGEDAGSLLSLEAGVHRWEGQADPAHLMVEVAAFRATLQDDDKVDEWRSLTPSRILLPSETRPLRATRLYRVDGKHVAVAGGKPDVECHRDSYWRDWDRIALAHLEVIERSNEPRAFDQILKAPNVDAMT
ncbi:MAG: AAA family ATPase [Myxococcota bacterium]